MQLVITLDGLRNMIRDLRAAGHDPGAILVSERQKKELKFEVMAAAGETMPDAEETVDQAICVVEGVPIVSNRTISNGKCMVIPRSHVTIRKLTNDVMNTAIKVA